MKPRKPKLKSKRERVFNEIRRDPLLSFSAGMLLGALLPRDLLSKASASMIAVPDKCIGCVGQFGVPCPPDCKNVGNHFDGCHKRDCLKECPE